MSKYINRAISIAKSSFLKLTDTNFGISPRGVVVYNQYPGHQTTNMSAFPVEKVIVEHRKSSLAYQHWFRYLHAIKLATKTKMMILDIGAGECLIGHFLYQNLRKPQYVAIDLNAKRLEWGILRGFGKENFLFIQRDLTRVLPFEDNTFDLIFAYEVIEHVEKKQAASLLRECYRVLKEGGKISLSTPNHRGKKVAKKYERFKVHGKDNFKEHPYEWGLKELANFMELIKFKVDKIYGQDFDHIRQLDIIEHKDEYPFSVYDELRSYFPSGITRLLGSLGNPIDASFVMIEAIKNNARNKS